MKRFWLLILGVCLLLPAVARGASKSAPDTISAKRALIEMPADVLPLITRNARLDMLDYMQLDSIYRVKNLLGGESYIEKLDSSYVKLHITDASSLEIKILQLKSGANMVAAIYTVGDANTVSDSRLLMFDPSMKPVATKDYFKQPVLKNFIKTPAGATMSQSEIENLMPFLTICFEFKPSSTDMIVSLTSQGTLPLESLKIVEPYLTPTLTYEWNGKNYKLKK